MQPIVPDRPVPAVTVVVPVHRNADTLARLHRRIVTALSDRPGGFEVIYVDDACPEQSGPVLDELAERDSRVRVIHLPDNVGQHRAILVGMGAATGSVVVSIDADLQDPPEAIPLLLARLDDGFDTVFAGRHGQYHESASRRLTSRFFKSVQSRVIGLPADASSYVALRRSVVDRLCAMPAGPQTMVAMIGFAGRSVTSVPVERAPRPVGTSAFSFRQRLSLAVGTLVWAARMRLTGRPR